MYLFLLRYSIAWSLLICLSPQHIAGALIPREGVDGTPNLTAASAYASDGENPVDDADEPGPSLTLFAEHSKPDAPEIGSRLHRRMTKSEDLDDAIQSVFNTPPPSPSLRHAVRSPIGSVGSLSRKFTSRFFKRTSTAAMRGYVTPEKHHLEPNSQFHFLPSMVPSQPEPQHRLASFQAGRARARHSSPIGSSQLYRDQLQTQQSTHYRAQPQPQTQSRRETPQPLSNPIHPFGSVREVSLLRPLQPNKLGQQSIMPPLSLQRDDALQYLAYKQRISYLQSQKLPGLQAALAKTEARMNELRPRRSRQRASPRRPPNAGKPLGGDKSHSPAGDTAESPRTTSPVQGNEHSPASPTRAAPSAPRDPAQMRARVSQLRARQGHLRDELAGLRPPLTPQGLLERQRLQQRDLALEKELHVLFEQLHRPEDAEDRPRERSPPLLRSVWR